VKKTILALTFMVGCDDYQLVGPEPMPTFLHVSTTVVHDDRLAASVTGSFSPGRDESGRERTMLDSTMVIDGEPLLPVRRFEGGRFYEQLLGSAGGANETAPDSVIVTGPVLERFGEWTQPMTLYLPRRLEAYRRDHAIGDTIVLQLPAVHFPVEASEPFVRWQLSVMRGPSGPAETSIQGSSTFSTRIEIPWEWLSEEIASGDSLEVLYSRFAGYPVADAPYPTRAAQLVIFRWRLMVVPGP
jgi:hypothetical protein